MKQIRYCLLSCERLAYSTQDKEAVQFCSACGAEQRQGRAAGTNANEVTCTKKETPQANRGNMALTGTHEVTSSVYDSLVDTESVWCEIPCSNSELFKALEWRETRAHCHPAKRSGFNLSGIK